ncbi:hypothetical protein BsWGS_24590 [Bradybaena similaris]
MELRAHGIGLLTPWSLLVVLARSQETCPSGWFGSGCEYKCRCSDNVCVPDGGCGAEVPCQAGWFGPACQYVDLAYNRSTVQDVTDGNDTTCLTDSHITNVTVRFPYKHHVNWLRVRVNNPSLLYNLTVRFSKFAKVTCNNTTRLRLDETTLDIHCDNNQTFRVVTLSGAGLHSLCSVYISGGRNVALKQHATQSSTYSEHSMHTHNQTVEYTADKAVDGNTNADFYAENTCSHTNSGQPHPNLNVTFTRPQLVTKYVVYNRASAGRPHARQLKGFVLTSFSQSPDPVFTHTDTLHAPQRVYTVVPADVTSPIHMVNLGASNKQNTLTVCELEVYGDSACQAGQYGRECEHTCNCAGGGACLVSTGGCPDGCAAGFRGEDCWTPCHSGSYGAGCQSSCSQFCVTDNGTSSRVCSATNGTCLSGCRSGYRGLTCTERCAPGSFGPGCQSPCSQFCVRDNDPGTHFCDHTNGTCLHGCLSGYQGPGCTQRCAPGSFGPGCKSPCSQFCVRVNDSETHFCDHINGTCLHGCLSGYHGPGCTQRCAHGSFGPGCQSPCSQFCVRVNDSETHFCDHINGTCLHGCLSGYHGPGCTQRCAHGSFGPGCQSPCSQFCVRDNDSETHFCDHINGTCLHGCLSGYHGPGCTQRCAHGSFGPGCQSPCSQFCVRVNDSETHFCDHINGTCLHGCLSGYHGPGCTQRCAHGSFGPGCQSPCSQFCVRVNDSETHFCDHINGTCLHGCLSGYHGPGCTQKCTPGSFGPGCQSPCSQFCVRVNDPGTHFCDHINGMCLHGCVSGYHGPGCTERCDQGSYGPGCQSSCSQFCVRANDTGTRLCAHTDGACLHGCHSGYQGSTCTQQCTPGSFGPGCQSPCSQFCVRVNDPGTHFCDHINGMCLHGCVSGYHGPGCTERCDQGSYGPGCQSSCSQFCVRANDTGTRLCAHTDGACLHGCHSGYQGSTCTQRCDSGSYGQGCQSSCSQFCVRANDTGTHLCAHTDGACLHGCHSGYQGSTCTQHPENPGGPDKQAAVIVGCVLGVVVLAAVTAAIIIVSRRRWTISAEISYNSMVDMTEGNYSRPQADGETERQTQPDQRESAIEIISAEAANPQSDVFGDGAAQRFTECDNAFIYINYTMDGGNNGVLFAKGDATHFSAD